MRYLITVPAAARRLSATTFAAESSFVRHLRELRRELGPRFDEITVAMPSMGDIDWQQQKSVYETVDEASEGIRLEELHRYGCGKLAFLARSFTLLPKIARLAKGSDLVHSHFSYDLFRAVGAWFCVFGKLFGKRVIAVEDIDRRRDALMNYRTGRWTKRQYLMCRYLYDPVRHLLQHAYVRGVDLMLFKEPQQVVDYGRGAAHVRLFLDPHFAAQDVADDAFVAHKLTALEDGTQPLRLLYFGRLVPYKGVYKMLEAVACARQRGANVTFDIMGCGERDTVEATVQRLGLGSVVRWLEPRPYGAAFFEVLRARDALLACPLTNDTPRSAWDALACGLPLVAFDSPFYQSMAACSQAVELTPWPEVAALADKIVALAADKTRLAPLVVNAVRTARANTGESWLRRRVQWIDELYGRVPLPVPAPASTPAPAPLHVEPAVPQEVGR
jgi:glycosyltransferase involved in cell wall biosynthesis